MSDINDDIAASIASLAAGSGDAGAAPAAPAPVERTNDDVRAAVEGRERNPDGTFKASGSQEGAPEAAGSPPAPTPGGSPTPTPDGQPAPAPAAPGTPEAAPAPAAGPVTFDPAKPPSAWTQEMKSKWNDIPEDIRKEITRREEATHQGFEKYRKQMEPAQDLFNHISRYGQYFNQIQRDPKQYLNDTIRMEQSLTLGNPTQKFETLLQIGDHYGIPIRQIIDGAMNGGLANALAEGHKRHNTPVPLPPEVQQELEESRQWRQQQQQAENAAKIKSMASDSENFPIFNEITDKMSELLESGQAQSLEDAYALAVFRDPALRAREAAVRAGAAQANAIKQRQAAAAAVATPPAAPIVSGAPAEPQSTEDYVRQAMAAAANGGRA